MMNLTESVWSYRVEAGVAVLTIDAPPVNALSHKVRIALSEGVARALADASAGALVIICAGRTFFAGADVSEIGKPIQPPLLGDVMALFEASAKPIVSAMHGTALGGGLELALAGHYRVAVPSAVVGLPEVALGLLPGAGGTQRVPRLIGVAAAIDMIGLGRHVKAPEACALGLIDQLVPEGELEAGAVAFARKIVESQAPLRRVRDLSPDLGLDEARKLFEEFRAKHPALFIGVKAADGVLRAIEAAVTLPFEQGIEHERAISRALTASPESAAQRHLFFAERAAAKLPGAEKEKPAEGEIEIIEAEGDLAAYKAAIAASAAETIVVTRFVEELADLAAASAHPRRVVGLARTEGVAEIVVGPETAPSAALAAMAMARKAGTAAIFVAPGRGLVLARLKAALEASISALLNEGVPAGDIAATGSTFGFRRELLPAGEGSVSARLQERLLAPVLAEALAIAADGVARRSSDIDFAMVRAGLWPLWRGGPAFMAERAEVAVAQASAQAPAAAPA
jgi:enoyl-CoA hydratase/carnithine racemase